MANKYRQPSLSSVKAKLAAYYQSVTKSEEQSPSDSDQEVNNG